MTGDGRMRLVSWKAVRRGGLRGFAAVELPIGLTIHDVPLFASKDGSVFAVLPEKPKVNREGRVFRNGDGTPAYTPVLTWRDRRLSDAFSARVVELVRASYPDDLDGEAAVSVG